MKKKRATNNNNTPVLKRDPGTAGIITVTYAQVNASVVVFKKPALCTNANTLNGHNGNEYRRVSKIAITIYNNLS